MSDTKYTDASGSAPGTLVVASWLNDVNTNTYTALVSVAGTNTITATGATTVTVGYPRGVAFRFIPVNTNTGPCTINISGLGVKNITKFGTAPLVAGDLIAGSWAYLTYDGTQFQLINAGGPLTGVDTYVTTAGTTTAYTLTFQGSFAFVSGYAVKLIFNATNTSTTPTLNVNGSGAVAMKVMSSSGTKIDPIVGAFAVNTPATAIYDGVNWNVVVEYPSGRLLNIQYITASGTYTPTPGTTRAVAEAVGGGGGGGGTPAAGAGLVAGGSGGGSGAYGRKTQLNPAAQAVTVGAQGIGVATGNGTTGGTTVVFGMTLPGGPGGALGGAVAANSLSGAPSGNSGSPTGADVGTKGASSSLGVAAIAGSVYSSSGANSPFGSGGAALFLNATGATNGIPGDGFGSGGGGGVSSNGGALTAGGVGQPGIIIISEYS